MRHISEELRSMGARSQGSTTITSQTIAGQLPEMPRPLESACGVGRRAAVTLLTTAADTISIGGRRFRAGDRRR